ncbi:GNAT family N-acetyltransferase [Nitratidesulfovibrio termitidis]|uniref:GNAT family N-acetyltransferase n=1 Tax=Nitratidesulfovibrio termitidis TaxID=42252 RepID=UPI000413B370|nr:GNAT family protein [Nitratidesulfovibrio termitidis]
MSDVVTIPFRPSHLASLELRAADAADLAGLDLADLAGAWAGHPAWTMLLAPTGATGEAGGRVIACYGAVLHGGTATLWALTTPAAEAVPLRLTRVTRALVRWLTGPMGCHRVEALVHVDNTRSLHWLERMLGMRREGLLRQCGPNRQDRYLLALVKEPKAKEPVTQAGSEA